jgi:hypothetical protein
MTEAEFIDAIDSSLMSRPSGEISAAIDVAAQISDNAVLMVVYELASTTDVGCSRYLAQVRDRSRSPVVALAADVAEAFLRGEGFPDEYREGLLSAARATPGLFNALALIELVDPRKAAECEEIRSSWSDER